MQVKIFRRKVENINDLEEEINNILKDKKIHYVSQSESPMGSVMFITISIFYEEE